MKMMDLKSMTFENKPFVVIMGSTGTGKTKLAVWLAKKFDGEVISTDALQVYKVSDISIFYISPVGFETALQQCT